MARYQRPSKFYKDDTCRDCGQGRDLHESIPYVSSVSVFFRLACPDLDTPNPARVDDPWDPPDRRNPGDLLFDQYC